MLADDHFYRRYENSVLKDLPNKGHLYIYKYTYGLNMVLFYWKLVILHDKG